MGRISFVYANGTPCQAKLYHGDQRWEAAQVVWQKVMNEWDADWKMVAERLCFHFHRENKSTGLMFRINLQNEWKMAQSASCGEVRTSSKSRRLLWVVLPYAKCFDGILLLSKMMAISIITKISNSTWGFFGLDFIGSFFVKHWDPPPAESSAPYRMLCTSEERQSCVSHKNSPRTLNR